MDSKNFRETGYEELNQILLLSNGNFFKRIKFTDKKKQKKKNK